MSRHARRRPGVAAALAVAATLWCVALPATPLVLSSSDAGGLRGLAVVFHGACGRLCHQRPERCFQSLGRPWPVCARCAGLYAGAAAGAWLATLSVGLGRRRGASRPAGRYRWPLLAAGVPTAAAWAVEFAGLAALANTARCLLALPLGAVAAWIVTSMAGGRVE
jgi:hypothetical protein